VPTFEKRERAGWLRRLAPFIKPYRGTFAASLALSVLGQGLVASTPLIQQVIVDDAVVSDRRPLAPLLALLVGVSVVSYGCNFLRRQLGSQVCMDVQNDLRIAIHRHLQHLDFSRHDDLSTGDVMSRATADVTLIQMFLQQIPVIAANITLLAVALTVMVVLSPLLTVVVAVFVPAFAVVAKRFRDRAFPASWNDQRLAGAVAGVVDEAVSGVRVVKAFAQEDHEQALLEGSARDLFASRMRTARITARFGAGLQALPGMGQFGVLALGGWLALEGRVTVGVFAAFSSYLVQLVFPVRMLSTVMSSSQQARAGTERVTELLDLQPMVADHPDARPLVDPAGGVTLDAVTFAYGDGPPVLRDVTLRIEPGERVAVVGGSGSGKSTLAYLIARYYDPDSGVVRIDGHDVRDVTLDSLRRAAGVVFEESFLFSSTIGDNIAFGRPDADDADIEAAARGASRCRAVSASGSPWPALPWPIPACWCSTTPPRPWMLAPRPPSTPRSTR
jgi:ATP-binding cassette subfamily B protein